LRLFIWFFLVVFVITLVLSFAFFNTFTNTMKKELGQANARMLLQTNYLVDEIFSQLDKQINQQILSILRKQNLTNGVLQNDYYELQKLYDDLLSLKNSNDFIHSAYIYFDQSNLIISSSMGITPMNYFFDTLWAEKYSTDSKTDLLLETRKPYNEEYENDMEYVLRYYSDTDDVITRVFPIPSTSNSPGGAVVVNIYEKSIAEMANQNTDDAQLDVVILNSEGRIIASQDKNDLYSYFDPSIFVKTITNQQHGSFITSYDGSEWIFSYVKSDIGWYFLSKMLLEKAMLPATSIQRNIIFTSIALLCVGLLVVIFLSNQLYKPIKNLAKLVGKGVPQPPQPREDEFNYIHDSVNNLIEKNTELTDMLENSKAILKHRTLSLLLQGKLKDGKDTQKRLQYMGLVFKEPYFCVLIVEIDNGRAQLSGYYEKETELMKLELKSYIRACAEKNVGCHLFEMEDERTAAILNFGYDGARAFNTILHICESIRSKVYVSENLPFTVSIGIGSVVAGRHRLQNSFSNALSAINYKLVAGPAQIIYYENINFSTALPSTSQNKLIGRLLSAIQLGNEEKAIKRIGEIFEFIGENNFSAGHIQQFFIKVFGDIANLLMEMGIEFKQIAEEGDFIISDYRRTQNA
jgi:sugar diacid utilization regulator